MRRNVFNAAVFCLTGFVVAIVGVQTSLASGILIPDGRSGVTLRLGNHFVEARIVDRVAHTTVNQVFINPSNQRLEATYIFPIPEGADLTDFRMTFNGKMVQGEVLPADKARQIYESIVRQQRDPGLIEFIGRRLLKARIFPIEPKSETEIQVSYQQIVEPMSGMWRYRYPLRTPGTSGRTYGTVRFSVDIRSKAPLKSIWSPSHQVEVVRDGEHHARVEFEKSNANLDDDFLVLFDTDDQDVGMSLVAHRDDPHEDGHFLMLISPKQLWDDDESVPQDYVFVVDTSGSMAGEKIEQARDALKYCVNRLEADDRFAVIRFSTGFDLVFDELRRATTESKAKAVERIDDYKATGGTNIHDALRAALKLREAESDRPFVLIFVTDGQGDRSREEIEKMLAEHTNGFKQHLHIFPFGVGHDVNTALLDSLATNYGGMPTYVQPGENLEYVLGDFFAVFSEPVLTDLRLTMPDAAIVEKFPPDLGDLYHGKQLIIAGRFGRDATGRVVLTGQRGGERVKYVWEQIKFQSTDEADYVSRIWAGRKIAYLLDRIRLSGEKPELVKEVMALAERYGIQTPYSAWLVAPEHQRFARTDGDRRSWDLLIPRSLASGRAGRGGGGVSFEGAPAFDLGDFPALASVGGEFSPADASRVQDELRGLRSMGKALFEDAGESAFDLSAKLSGMRESDNIAEGRMDQRLLAVRHFAGRKYYNVRGILIDVRYDQSDAVLKIKFGSDAYFDLVMARPDLRQVLAASKYSVLSLNESLTVVILDDGGEETLTDEQKTQIADTTFDDDK